MPTLIQIIPIIIAVFSLIVAYLGYHEKKSDKKDKELNDKIKAQVLSDAVTLKAENLANSVTQKAQILSDAFNLKTIEIKELQKQSNECDLRQTTMQEQMRGIVRDADKMDKKLDKILEMMYNDRHRDDDTN